MSEAYVLGGVRTPFARYGGSLSHIRTDDLLGMTMKGACQRVGVDLDQVEDIVAGCVNPAHEGMGDIARWRRCRRIPRQRGRGDSQPVLWFVAERHGQHQPCHQGRRPRGGHRVWGGIDVPVRVGAHQRGRTVQPAGSGVHARHHVAGAGRPPNSALLARNAYIAMIETAQSVADRYGLTRKEMDAFSLRSQEHAKAARDSGQVVPEIADDDGGHQEGAGSLSRMTSPSRKTQPPSDSRRCPPSPALPI